MPAHAAHAPPRQPIPVFHLYGEAAHGDAFDFAHVEPLAARLPLHDWEIKPHRHARAHQLIWVRAGGGRAWFDEARLEFGPGMILSTPPGAVHAYHFEPGAAGHVLTLSQDLIEARIRPAMDGADRAALAGALALPGEEDLEPIFAGLAAVLAGPAPGRMAALCGHVLQILAVLARRRGLSGQGLGESADHALTRRFLALVEREFRAHAPIAFYCDKLAVSEKRLARACRQAAGASPLDLVQQRLALEAKRSLLFTPFSAAEIAYDLGFSDPAYFSRFFQRREGLSPQAFRRAQGV